MYKLNSNKKSITLDLLILNYNKFEEYGRACIQSLLDQDLDDSTKIVVLDNNSTDGSREKITNFLENNRRVEFFQSEINLGFAGGMNYLANKTKGDWLLLINNDTYFPEDSINQFKDILEKTPEYIGALGPITNAAGNEQNINLSGTFEKILSEQQEIIKNKLNMLFDVPRLDFFCVAIKRSVWNALNGLDEIYERGYYEDFDFCVRLANAGFKMAITEDVFVYHKGSGVFSEDKNQRRLIKKNKEIFTKRYPKQKLYHVRENNLEMIKKYHLLELMDLTYKNLILVRKERRNNFLINNMPKSLLKKYLWKFKIKNVIKN
ncbi:MAG: glycosyltransferase [Betaproteobacteria bacterium]|nr:glycosyltransferase [Betaproteobacteria bacterium]